MRKPWNPSRSSSWLAGALVLVLAGCTGLVRQPPPPETSPTRLGSCPNAGYAVRQLLTSRIETSWTAQMKDRVKLSREKSAGLRLDTGFAVVACDERSLEVKVVLHDVEILQEGVFVKAPFLPLDPPRQFSFTVDLQTRKADFSTFAAAQKAWFEGLRGSPAGEMISPSFDPDAYAAQVGEMLSAPVTSFLRKRYPAGKSLVESQTFYLPATGPTFSFGPVPVTVETRAGETIASPGVNGVVITGGFGSQEVILGPEQLSPRLRLFGIALPPIYESVGSLKGTLRAVVDRNSGWVRESTSTFDAALTIRFDQGEFSETSRGTREVTVIGRGGASIAP